MSCRYCRYSRASLGCRRIAPVLDASAPSVSPLSRRASIWRTVYVESCAKAVSATVSESPRCAASCHRASAMSVRKVSRGKDSVVAWCRVSSRLCVRAASYSRRRNIASMARSPMSTLSGAMRMARCHAAIASAFLESVISASARSTAASTLRLSTASTASATRRKESAGVGWYVRETSRQLRLNAPGYARIASAAAAAAATKCPSRRAFSQRRIGAISARAASTNFTRACAAASTRAARTTGSGSRSRQSRASTMDARTTNSSFSLLTSAIKISSVRSSRASTRISRWCNGISSSYPDRLSA